MNTYSPELPAGSSLGKSYEYGVDLNLASALAPLWQAVRRILNVNPQMTPITMDAASYDDKGSPNADVSAWSWVLTFNVWVNRNTSTGLLPPELLALQQRYGDAKGNAAIIEARWYHKPADGSKPDPREAFQGTATVGITRVNTGADGANEQWQVTLTGKGYATRIDNPFDGWADSTDVPEIVSISPAGQSAGEQVTIAGANFVGATGVTVGGETAQFIVVSSSTIVAVIPAAAAGDAPVVVTGVAGASDPATYTVA